MPPRSATEGTLRLHRRFRSPLFGLERELVVWLPPGCDGRRRRHPVVYFFDGQNVFDPRTAFFGNAWHAGAAAARLIAAGAIEPPIMVGIYNGREQRIHEYTPTRGRNNAPGERSQGRLRDHALMVATDVVAFIDARYPTTADPAHRALVGSSLGGLAALYGALWHPRVFGAAAPMSPSVWWDQLAVVRFVAGLKRKLPVRLWLDIGTGERGWQNTRLLRDALITKGWSLEPHGEAPADLHYLEVEGAGHHESTWAARLGDVLQWLFPAGS
jgi:predicted alpha/beta superfamily hydrolase